METIPLVVKDKEGGESEVVQERKKGISVALRVGT